QQPRHRSCQVDREVTPGSSSVGHELPIRTPAGTRAGRRPPPGPGCRPTASPCTGAAPRRSGPNRPAPPRPPAKLLGTVQASSLPTRVADRSRWGRVETGVSYRTSTPDRPHRVGWSACSGPTGLGRGKKSAPRTPPRRLTVLLGSRRPPRAGQPDDVG